MKEKRKNKLEKLLEENLQSYYWIGFILADGHISKINRLNITLAEKDVNHLLEFEKFIEVENSVKKSCKKHNNQYQLSIMDVNKISKIVEKFDINNRKTYNPPNINIENDEMFLAMWIGFVDGDGCIKNQTGRKDCLLCIKIHSNWLNVLKSWSERLSSITKTNIPIPIINNKGYVRLNITNHNTLSFIKKFIIKNNLYVMNRKWDNINEHFIGTYEIANAIRNRVLDMIKSGYRNKDICNELKLSPARISNIINKELQYV